MCWTVIKQIHEKISKLKDYTINYKYNRHLDIRMWLQGRWKMLNVRNKSMIEYKWVGILVELIVWLWLMYYSSIIAS